MDEAYDLRDNWEPDRSIKPNALGQQPGTPDPKPDLGGGTQAHDNR